MQKSCLQLISARDHLACCPAASLAWSKVAKRWAAWDSQTIRSVWCQDLWRVDTHLAKDNGSYHLIIFHLHKIMQYWFVIHNTVLKIDLLLLWVKCRWRNICKPSISCKMEHICYFLSDKILCHQWWKSNFSDEYTHSQFAHFSQQKASHHFAGLHSKNAKLSRWAIPNGHC